MNTLQSEFRKQDILCDPRKQYGEIAPAWRPPQSYLWLDVTLALAVCFMAGFELDRYLSKPPINQRQNVAILKKFDDYRFLLKFKEDRTPTEAWFCRDYKPDLVPGCFLTDLTYEEKQRCWEVDSGIPGLGYHYLHDSDGNDIDQRGNVCFRANQ